MTTYPLLTQKDVCAILRISTKKLQRMRREKRIQFVKLGPRCIRFRQEELQRVIEKAGKEI